MQQAFLSSALLSLWACGACTTHNQVLLHTHLCIKPWPTCMLRHTGSLSCPHPAAAAVLGDIADWIPLRSFCPELLVVDLPPNHSRPRSHSLITVICSRRALKRKSCCSCHDGHRARFSGNARSTLRTKAHLADSLFKAEEHRAEEDHACGPHLAAHHADSALPSSTAPGAHASGGLTVP